MAAAVTSNSEAEAPVKRSCFGTLELVMSGLVFGLWNNVSTILNAKILFESGHNIAGGLTVLFLLFPGLVTSIGKALFKAFKSKFRLKIKFIKTFQASS